MFVKTLLECYFITADENESIGCDQTENCTFTNSCIISSENICDGIFNCNDNRDECNTLCLKEQQKVSEKHKTFAPILDYVANCFGGYNDSISGSGEISFYLVNNKNYTQLLFEKGEKVVLKKNQTYKFREKFYTDLKFLCDLESVSCPWLFQCSDNHKIETLKVNDKVADCVDGSDEICSDDLIQPRSIRMYMWFIGVFGAVFNLLLSFKYFRKFWLSSCQTAASCFVSFVFSLLLLNNFAMSIVILFLIISHYVLYPFTCARRYFWYSSSTCSFVGTLITFCFFSHSFTILYMSALRLHIVRKQSSVNRLDRKYLFLTFSLLYMMSLITALMPNFLQSKHFKTFSNSKKYAQKKVLDNYIYRYRENIHYFSFSGTCFPFFIQVNQQHFHYYTISLLSILSVISIFASFISFLRYRLNNKISNNPTSNGGISNLSNRKIKILVSVNAVVTFLLTIFTSLCHTDVHFMKYFYLVLVFVCSFLDPLVLSGFDRLIANQYMLIVYIVRKRTIRHKEDHEVDYDMDEREMNE